MNRYPIVFVALFSLGASVQRITGALFLNYGSIRGMDDAVIAVDPVETFAGAVAVFSISIAVLLYCLFLRLPSIHPIMRTLSSHLSAGIASVCLWRLYARFVLGSVLPGVSWSNSLAVVSALLFVSLVWLYLMLTYSEEA